MAFLPVMALDHSSMTYKLELLKNTEFMFAGLVLEPWILAMLEHTDNGQGQNFTL